MTLKIEHGASTGQKQRSEFVRDLLQFVNELTDDRRIFTNSSGIMEVLTGMNRLAVDIFTCNICFVETGS